MLTPEQARSELEKLANPEWIAHRVVAADTLKPEMRETARVILGADEPERKSPTHGEEQRRQKALLKTVGKMEAPERTVFFEALAPGHGAAIERGWNLFDRLPYQSNASRKPFRAPRHPVASVWKRVHWLGRVLTVLGPYQQKLPWFAAWAPHLHGFQAQDVLGILFAAAMDAGGGEGEEIFQILRASGNNEHEIGGMGRHVTRALLTTNRVEAWEYMERMLLAAQREEGLRQAILETVDEAHPEAFRRMLKLILDNDLARFSSTIRAFDTWLGYMWGAPAGKAVTSTIEKMLLYLEDANAREAAWKGNDAEQAYLGLWSMAFNDGVGTVAPATELLKHPKAEHRYVAAHLLAQLRLVASQRSLLAALEDADLRIAYRALGALHRSADERIKKDDLFERLEKLVARAPAKPEKLAPVVWPWTAAMISKEFVADALPNNLGKRPPSRLIPHLNLMGANQRVNVMQILASENTWAEGTRDTLFALLGDPSRSVRETALRHLKKCQMTTTEAGSIEVLLDRKSADLRRGALTLLFSQTDGEVLNSADRLTAANSQPQRVAGLELLRQLVEAKRSGAEARERAKKYSDARPKLNDAERQQIEVILAVDVETPKLSNALGLVSHEDRTWPASPVNRNVALHSPAGRKIVGALCDLFDAHAKDIVSYEGHDGEKKTTLLAEAHFRVTNLKLPEAEARRRLPLVEVWEDWNQNRGPELRDADGMELLRAVAWYDFAYGPFVNAGGMLKKFPQTAQIFGENLPSVKPHYMRHLTTILFWLLRINHPPRAAEFCLDAMESAFALVPKDTLFFTEAEAAKLAELENATVSPERQRLDAMREKNELVHSKSAWRDHRSPFHVWLSITNASGQYAPELWGAAAHVRRWKLLRWFDEPVRACESGGASDVPEARCLPRERGSLVDLCLARAHGGATDADILEHLIGDRRESNRWRHDFRALDSLTKRKPAKEFAQYDFLFPLADACRKRVLAVELTRGENPTAASGPALSIGSVEGIATLTAVLRALGKRNFTRGWARDNQSVETVFSHLARCSFPGVGETAEDFARHMKAAEISEKRQVELAVYAPQWAAFVEKSLGWDGLTEGVWWIHAHTKGDDWRVDKDIRELWEADMNARTSLSGADLVEGGVDVAWFHRVHATLGAKRWETLCDAAKFASTGSGHARAMLFASAMLGDVSKKELVERINKKRHQDSVRSLGLLPLAGGKKREADVLDRYKVLQEFRRQSKQFGSMRQASEKRAAHISQQNLARTADFSDPIRLEWAMEARAVEDLADGPIQVSVEGVELSLGIDVWGEIELTVTKDGKTLADIPAKLKKNPKIVALRERKVELKRQAARIRPSLEQFMVRGDEFTGAELIELMAHPLLAPMLKNLVIIGDGIMGYPIHGGKALEDHAGQVEAIKSAEKLRIAHPHDLLPAAAWIQWQKDCFARERIQPFKQVFRELYPLTEKQEGSETRRYAGHQVQPRQALALLGQRGWVHHPEEGVRKVFHDAGLVAWLSFQETFYTPAEIEGLTLESVFFTRRADHKVIKLEELPPRLFSETMRDLDLVVSVAHRGGVDPEASASTIEMRATLIRETTRLLKIKNVELKERYALIKGQLGEYSVHLGSAATRKMPGESLFIVAVHSQHRGRLFLPFADDDPRTAEVMSKILLLARDKEIKDPNILDQIRQS